MAFNSHIYVAFHHSMQYASLLMLYDTYICLMPQCMIDYDLYYDL